MKYALYIGPEVVLQQGVIKLPRIHSSIYGIFYFLIFMSFLRKSKCKTENK
jgi:hypothetical protein